MKKFLTAILLIMTVAVSACWFDAVSWKGVYFTRVNDTDCTPIFGTFPAYTMDNDVDEQLFPLDIYAVVMPSETNNIKLDTVLLQWKYVGATITGWKTICTLEDFNWTLSYSNVEGVCLFGKRAVNPAGVQTGDSVVFRLYVADAVSCNAQLDNDTTYLGLLGWEKLWLLKVKKKGSR